MDYKEEVMDYKELAKKTLDGALLTQEEMVFVLHASDRELLSLLEAASSVREHYFGRKVQLNALINAKSGFCSEDCAYCSQSLISTAEIEKHPLLPKERLVEGAVRAKEAGALRYCVAMSGRGPIEWEVEEIAKIVREIKKTVDINICCSLGFLTESKAKALKKAGVDRINHNLNTSKRYYPKICSTHTYEDRIKTIRNIKKVELSLCSGGIIGMGEEDQDIIEMALALRELDVDSIPLNFLHPIPGTPLAESNYLTPQRCLKALCLFRFLNPGKEIRVAGGRELNLRSLQALSLYPANSIFIGGYLTTPGQEASEAHRMVEDLGFEFESQ